MEILKKNKKIIAIVLAVVFVVGVIMFIYYKNNSDNNVDLSNFYSDSDMLNLENENDESVGSTGENLNDKYASGGNDNQGKGDNSQKEGDDLIYVHVIGEVNSEGIITLKMGQRIVDAIEKAGGVTESADLSKVNLAFVLSDGQKIRIPSVNDSYEDMNDMQYITSGSGDSVILDDGSGTKVNGKENYIVNINTATQTELETLNGIGPSLANNILEYRKQNGKFKSIDELRNVSGIGDSKFNQIKNNVTV